MRNCFFIGHGNTPERIYPLLAEAVERHITEYDVTDFYVGHYGNFDRMAARAVKEAKKKYPYIQLILILPYHPAERPIEKPEGFDDTYYPLTNQHIPKRLAILKTNQIMIQFSRYLISYVKHSWGGASKALEYAKKREPRGWIQIENLAEDSQPNSEQTQILEP